MYNNWNRQRLVPAIYSCPWCDRAFSNPAFIRPHVRTFHPYHCNDCLKVYHDLPAFILHSHHCVESADDVEYHKNKVLISWF